LQDYELIAQQLSGVGDKVKGLAERLAALEETVGLIERRMVEIERVNARLEDAALTTARALQEISGHWDAVYEAMRREKSQDAGR
jgi:hypothetical protein